MSLTRAFIALEIPKHTHQEISIKTAWLRKDLGTHLVRWVSPENIHLTLKFLSDISSTKIEQVTQALSDVAGRHERHKIIISGLGTFPNMRQPRVIWIGIQAPESLKALYQDLEAATTKLGFPPEKRSFNPHLTIGRVRQQISTTKIERLRNAMINANFGFVDTVEVDNLHLFKSDLKPSGAVYTKLYAAPLNYPSTR